MQFTQIPPDYSPGGQEAVYAFETETAADHEFRIVETASGEVLGTKRFRAAASGRFDIAPYLRGRFDLTPATGPTGFARTAGRSVTVRVETTGATARVRTFLPGTAAAQVPQIRTSFPGMRLLGSGECDEITLLTAGACTATLVVQRGDTTEGVTFGEEGSGLHVFRIDAAEFPGAETMRLAFDGIGALEYRIVERPVEARRLAWVSGAGSVERYTFPVEKSCDLHAEKQQIRSEAGLRTVGCRTERRITLLSAFEMPRAAEAVAEVIAAPQVWLTEADGSLTSAEIPTSEAVVRRHGTLCCIEVTFVSHPKNRIR